MPDSLNIYDKITTTIVINTWSLFNRSGKKKICFEYEVNKKEDEYLLALIFSTRHIGLYPKIYFDMPFMDYIKYRLANWKSRKSFGYSWIKKNKYVVEKERLLGDARIAYGINNEKVYEEIYDEFFGKDEQKNV